MKELSSSKSYVNRIIVQIIIQIYKVVECQLYAKNWFDVEKYDMKNNKIYLTQIHSKKN